MLVPYVVLILSVGADALLDVGAARSALLSAIQPTNRGFGASAEQQQAVRTSIEELAAVSPQKMIPDITGDWELIWTDAPDILGLDAQAGPFNRCLRVGQQISEADKTIMNVIEYGPREWVSSLVGGVQPDVASDVVQQRVVTGFERREGSPTTVDLKIRGASFQPKQLFGVTLDAVPALKLGPGPVELPFGTFEVLYCEGPMEAPALAEDMAEACEIDGLSGYGECAPIRVIRTQQGYYSINRRMGPAEGWGMAP